MYLCLKKNFCFPETTRSFKCEWLLLFLWLRYSPSEEASYCLSCALFGHDFPTKASRAKNLFSQPFRPSAVSYFRAHCEGKKKKIDPSHETVQSLHFSIWPKLEAIFSQIKDSSYEINVFCDRKYIKRIGKKWKQNAWKRSEKSFHHWGFHDKKYNWYGNSKRKYYIDEASSRCYNYWYMRLY